MQNPIALRRSSHTQRTCLRVVDWKFILLAGLNAPPSNEAPPLARQFFIGKERIS
jgi:hypothetical protein